MLDKLNCAIYQNNNIAKLSRPHYNRIQSKQGLLRLNPVSLNWWDMACFRKCQLGYSQFHLKMFVYHNLKLVDTCIFIFSSTPLVPFCKKEEREEKILILPFKDTFLIA